MYILDNKEKELRKQAMGHLGFALFCALFGGIYEQFSHEVYSFYMIYAFAIPLVFGTAFYFLLDWFDKKVKQPLCLSLWNMAIITLTVGSLYRGVIDIYGTTNKKVIIYVVAAFALGLSAIVLNAVESVKGRVRKDEDMNFFP